MNMRSTLNDVMSIVMGGWFPTKKSNRHAMKTWLLIDGATP